MSIDTKAAQFHQWVIESGRSPSTADKYTSSIKGSLTTWAKNESIVSDSLFEYDSGRSISSIANEIRELDIFIQRNSTGKGMTHHALKAYESYCIERFEHSSTADIITILKENVSKTERERLIAARLGQGAFRRKLVDIWGCCSVSGYKVTGFLVASHIKPWRISSNQERLDPSNGLLLTPNLDKAFDRLLISFQDSGEIIISPELVELRKIAINSSMAVRMAESTRLYMEHHRRLYFDCL